MMCYTIAQKKFAVLRESLNIMMQRILIFYRKYVKIKIVK